MLAKSKLNNIEVLISKALIDSVINPYEFVLINDVQKEYDEMKKETKNKVTDRNVFDRTRKFIKEFSLFLKQCYHIV